MCLIYEYEQEWEKVQGDDVEKSAIIAREKIHAIHVGSDERDATTIAPPSPSLPDYLQQIVPSKPEWNHAS